MPISERRHSLAFQAVHYQPSHSSSKGASNVIKLRQLLPRDRTNFVILRLLILFEALCNEAQYS